MDKFIEDDAVAMMRILAERLPIIASDYMLIGEECTEYTDQVKAQIRKGALYGMYAATNRTEYADNLLEDISRKLISRREKIEAPSLEQVEYAVTEVIDAAAESVDTTDLERYVEAIDLDSEALRELGVGHVPGGLIAGAMASAKTGSLLPVAGTIAGAVIGGVIGSMSSVALAKIASSAKGVKTDSSPAEATPVASDPDSEAMAAFMAEPGNERFRASYEAWLQLRRTTRSHVDDLDAAPVEA
jgi:hypothetical protein